MNAQRALFVFAHQDDEYGAAPWIVQELREGSDVACLYLTGGGLRVTPTIRDEETRSALRSFGLPEDGIAFLHAGGDRIDDQKLAERSGEALERVEGWLERTRFAPQRVYAPSYEGGHADHDAAHLVAAVVAAQCGAQAWHFSLYNGYRVPAPFFRVLAQLPSDAPARFAQLGERQRWSLAISCRHYRSQWRTWAGLFPGAFLQRLVLRRECVVRFEPARLFVRPHDGTLLYERLFAIPYDAFSRGVAGVRERLRAALAAAPPEAAEER